jgi:hypothetical protein
VLPFKDPDGLMLALVDVAGAETEPAWHTGDIPAEHAIRGFHGLLEDASPPDEKLLAMGEVVPLHFLLSDRLRYPTTSSQNQGSVRLA